MRDGDIAFGVDLRLFHGIWNMSDREEHFLGVTPAAYNDVDCTLLPGVEPPGKTACFASHPVPYGRSITIPGQKVGMIGDTEVVLGMPHRSDAIF